MEEIWNVDEKEYAAYNNYQTKFKPPQNEQLMKYIVSCVTSIWRPVQTLIELIVPSRTILTNSSIGPFRL